MRCAACHRDNHALATTCSACGANLNTPEQAAFNQRLWDELRAAQQQGAEPAVPASPAAASGANTVLDPAQQRAVAEAMAREVAAQTRAQLGGMGSSPLLHDPYSFTFWFLNKVPPRVAAGLVVGALVLSAAMMAYKHTRTLGFVSGILVGVALMRLYWARE
ncbi:MAG: hypothetical protein QM765_02240 [Myxococcales bacterium]